MGLPSSWCLWGKSKEYSNSGNQTNSLPLLGRHHIHKVIVKSIDNWVSSIDFWISNKDNRVSSLDNWIISVNNLVRRLDIWIWKYRQSNGIAI